MLKIEYKDETEDDLTDILDSLLRVRSTAFLAREFVFLHNELSEGYYELQEAMDTILMLIEPAMTYFSGGIPPKEKPETLRPGEKARKGAKG